MSWSGSEWVAKFPARKSLQDLSPLFRGNLLRFIEALTKGGAHVRVTSTLRPRERAYLMHYSWRIFKENLDADQVPSMRGVDIDWAHLEPADTRRAAGDMVRGFNTKFRPPLTSRHTEGRAACISVSSYLSEVFWNGRDQFRSVINEDELHAMGAKFTVFKRRSDAYWWSDDGC